MDKSRQEYWEARPTAKIEVAKEKAYTELYVRLGTKEGEQYLHELAIQRLS